MYYVQSPSRDSFTFNEGDSVSQSYARSTPSGSPLASPLHKSFSSKAHQHQAEMQHVHLPGNPKPGSRRVLPQPANANAAVAVTVPHKKGYQPWNTGGTIQEEVEHYPPGSRKRGISRWCAVFLSIFFALVGIVIVGLVFWLVCRPSAPSVEVKSINFQNFLLAEGDDQSGVPTKVLSVNCTTLLLFGNPSKYFGFHISPPNVELIYQQLTVAEGESEYFFQRKRSSGTLPVDVHANRTPVYGAGPNLVSTFSSGEGVPLQMNIHVKSQANVIWKIVRPEYKSSIACDLRLGPNKDGTAKLLSSHCKNNR